MRCQGYASSIAAWLQIAGRRLLASVTDISLMTGEVHEDNVAMGLLTISPSWVLSWSIGMSWGGSSTRTSLLNCTTDTCSRTASSQRLLWKTLLAPLPCIYNYSHAES